MFGKGVVQGPHVIRKQGAVPVQRGFVPTFGGSGLAFSGIALEPALGQALDQVAKKICGQLTLGQYVLGFRQHVVGIIVGHDRSEVCRSALVPRDLGDAARPCTCKVVRDTHGCFVCGLKDSGRLGQRHGAVSYTHLTLPTKA